MRVTAVRKGYFGGKIRDAGEMFDLPDALMGEGLKPSWVEAEGDTFARPQPADDADGSTPRKRVRKPKQVSAETPAPPPSGNGLTEALGGPPPDWLPGDITN